MRERVVHEFLMAAQPGEAAPEAFEVNEVFVELRRRERPAC
jgi:hypothetical protein